MRNLTFLALCLTALAAPAAAQKISALPAASTLTGSEKIAAAQGSGCATSTTPCATVALTPAQIATYIGASYQPLDSDLTSIAGQTTAANKCQYWSGAATAALYDCASFVRGLGTSADAAGFRTAIGLGTLATQSGTFFTSGTAASVTGTTTETTLATITIPAGAMGPNGQVEIIPLFSFTSSANNKTVKATFGGTTYYSQVYTANTGIQPIIRITNRNSASSQVGAPSASANGLNGFTTAMTTSTVNTGSSVTVTITGTLANTGETITLESYLVRVTYGA